VAPISLIAAAPAALPFWPRRSLNPVCPISKHTLVAPLDMGLQPHGSGDGFSFEPKLSPFVIKR
jgi:hypothetical protein